MIPVTERLKLVAAQPVDDETDAVPAFGVPEQAGGGEHVKRILGLEVPVVVALVLAQLLLPSRR